MGRAARPCRRDFSAFTLVELLVVIGIIAVLIGILLPVLARARQRTQAVACESNMRQVGMELLNYANHWRGWMFPPGLGSGSPPDQRWPVQVFEPPVWNPPVLKCPADPEPAGDHSYILNSHLTERRVKYTNTTMSGLCPADVVVMGEKLSTVDDYYMDPQMGDYTTKVEFYRHGQFYGSNYLYLDIHVESRLPLPASGDIDPWDVRPAQVASR